jgi:hypothetical protein
MIEPNQPRAMNTFTSLHRPVTYIYDWGDRDHLDALRSNVRKNGPIQSESVDGRILIVSRYNHYAIPSLLLLYLTCQKEHG